MGSRHLRHTQNPVMFALVDCNNFYASCERVFHPEWNFRPVVILSNNDGCIIARSNEAKALGIPMGAPFFQYKNLIENHNVIVCSSNYVLYGDMSNRVMQTLKAFSCDIQIYSIDEAFLRINKQNPRSQGEIIQKRILMWTGLPVSIGIAPTKTLAKVANHIAKKNHEHQGVYVFDSQDQISSILDSFPVNDLWGVGKRLSQKLYRLGIRTAKQLAEAPDEQIKKHLSILGLRTAWELRGVSCLPLEEVYSGKKSIAHSRAFATPIDTLEQLQVAVSSYTAQACQKLRSQNSLAASLVVFIEPHPFNPASSNNFYFRVALSQPTSYTPDLIHHAKAAVKQLFNPNHAYRKAGILLDGLVDKDHFQPDLFSSPQILETKQRQAMKVVDQINKKAGCNKIRFAAEGTSNEWKTRKQHSSPRYTTQWDDILTIKI